MKNIAEFKIRVPMQSPQGALEWDDVPIICDKEFEGDNQDMLTHAADLHAVRLLALVDREVRWNWRGNPQGHYFRPML